MSSNITVQSPSIDARRKDELCKGQFIYLNGYNVQRIVYELIKNYMISNTPTECGVTLAQSYDVDPTKSSIYLDIAYNWKTPTMDKVPGIYVQRGDIDITSPTIGQATHYDIKNSEDERIIFNNMPVKITCIAAGAVAMVENLAEYVKQPLMYFRTEVKNDFKLRGFRIAKITSPTLVPESKVNFMIDIVVNTSFDDNWIIQKDDLKIKTVGLEILEGILKQDCGCN